MQSRGHRSASGSSKKPESGSPDLRVVTDVIESALDSGRLGLNEVLRASVGLEVKKAKSRKTEPNFNNQSKGNTNTSKTPEGYDSFFWNPYAEGSPFTDRKKYIDQFKKQIDESSQSSYTYKSTDLVSEEEIRSYVDALTEDGSVSQISGFSAFLVPKTLYANVVKVSLHVFQVAFGALDGRVVLGRRLHLLKDRSWRSQWRVSSRYQVDSEIVTKLVTRIMKDHPLEPDIMAREVQRQMYENIVTLVFRLAFDLLDSCQLRVLGHGVTINIEVDENIAKAPGWEIDLDSGIFGRFDLEHKKEFVAQFVDDLLTDDSINIMAMPDVLERQLYIRVVLLLFDLGETACNHLRLHMAGIAIRPALDDP